MSKQNSLIVKARGLNTQPNELDVPEGSLRVAENVEITRDNVVQLSPGFADYSSNLPDFEPQQLFAYGGTIYAHHDNGIWYHDGSNWLRKRGAFGSKMTDAAYGHYLSGHLYFGDSNVIWDCNLATGTISLLAGRFNVSGDTDGTGDAARFTNPYGIADDGAGNLYVCDVDRHVIRKIVIATGVVTTFAGLAGTSGTTNNTGSLARFNAPHSIVLLGGDFYITDRDNDRIRKMTTGAVVTTAASGAPLDAPGGIATDGTYLYVANRGSGGAPTVSRVTTGAVITTIAGSTSGFVNGTGTAARFNSPLGLAYIGGSLYVADGGNDRIRKVAPPLTENAAIVTTLAGSGSNGTDDGIGTAASFTAVRGATSDGSNLYIFDSAARMVRRVYVDSGYVTTIIGLSTVPASFPTRADGIIVGPD